MKNSMSGRTGKETQQIEALACKPKFDPGSQKVTGEN